MTVRNLTNADRRTLSPLVKLCLATSLAAAATAAVAGIVDKLVAPWPVAVGLLLVSGFYLLLAVGYMIDRRPWSESPAAAIVAAPAPLAIELEDQAADEAVDEEPALSTEREMAQV